MYLNSARPAASAQNLFRGSLCRSHDTWQNTGYQLPPTSPESASIISLTRTAFGAQVHVKAGSRLVADFDSETDALEVLEWVRKLAAEAFGSESAVRLEAATGSVHIYITFVDDKSNISKFTVDLRRSGARITFIEDTNGQSGYMTPVAEGER